MPETYDLPANFDNWAGVMAELEASVTNSVDTATMADAATDAVWTPPTGLGELPADLRERAVALLAEQRGTLDVLAELHRETGRHLAAVRAVPTPGNGESVYLDVTG